MTRRHLLPAQPLAPGGLADGSPCRGFLTGVCHCLAKASLAKARLAKAKQCMVVPRNTAPRIASRGMSCVAQPSHVFTQPNVRKDSSTASARQWHTVRAAGTSSTCRAAGIPRTARGFTLLEILIAVVLSAMLMAGLWALLSTYEVLFSQGQAKAENAQLVRALFEQIARDLQCAIPDSTAALPGPSASVRRFGLFGTQSALQVDVLQANDPYGTLDSSAQDDQVAMDASENSQRVPELHTVQYLFEKAAESESPDRDTLAGLVRRELDWEAPAGERRDSGASRRTSIPGRSNRGYSSAGSSVDPMSVSATGLDPEDDSLLRVPEVVEFAFRYYDGSGWTSQWNSLTQKSLPVAVEVVLVLNAGQPSQRPQPAAAATGEESSQEPPAKTPEQIETRKHRLLVYLPAAARPHALGRSSRESPDRFVLSPALSAPPPPPPPPPAPGPPSSPPPFPQGGSAADSLRAVLPDQWMRAQP